MKARRYQKASEQEYDWLPSQINHHEIIHSELEDGVDELEIRDCLKHNSMSHLLAHLNFLTSCYAYNLRQSFESKLWTTLLTAPFGNGGVAGKEGKESENVGQS